VGVWWGGFGGGGPPPHPPPPNPNPQSPIPNKIYIRFIYIFLNIKKIIKLFIK